ncbi:hypothetical protein SI65_09813 [Aspergillus cristatus]|uniref:Uncharacterized protein n=1 Tax=Aspergillus cristatus TaxID=573508 RepID=A0A1E3B1M8_ASPCR|nr:hypothetical protein SI65_09813 [Aspergillus cristatus]
MDNCTIKRIGLRELALKDNTPIYTRKLGSQTWEPYATSDHPQPTDTRPLLLGLVREFQPNEAHHWSLFVAEEGKNGTLYQVTGDHTYMVHDHKKDVNMLCLNSFADIHQLAELDVLKAQMVEYWANQEPASRAESQAQVRDTCQSWIIRVVRRLIAEGIVEWRWDRALKDLIDSPLLLRLRERERRLSPSVV